MPRASNVPPLNLNNPVRNVQNSPNAGNLSAWSTDSPHSPRSPPLSPASSGHPTALDMQVRADNGPTSPRVGALPDAPSSPSRTSPKQHSRDASKSFFSNLMASKSSHKLQMQSQSLESSAAEGVEKASGRSRGNSKDRALQTLKKQASTPDLPRIMTANGRLEETSDSFPPASVDGTVSKQKSRSKLGGILARSRSGRPEDEKKAKQRPGTQLNLEVPPASTPDNDQYGTPLRTAPIKNSFPQPIQIAEGGSIRNRSADGRITERERNGNEEQRANGQHSSGSLPGRGDGSSLFANISSTGRGVGDRLGKAGRGWFNKMTRSGSTTEREFVPDEHYVCSTINLPLVKQTRKTRIAKKLELSKDKTEYWMPALPWRCIDYLNMQCEQEGLYRVPGSGRDVKFWQRRFDTEHDINLFEEPELYDVNTIASMFKAWLRDLPDELFPRAIQAKIVKECAGAQQTPQMLKDELSHLPPFNYYLLFAITCHLSLLHSYADQNKMDYRNLCICFQPCLKIDAFCFQFLVIDWKECWIQGCYAEKEYLAEEIRYEKEGPIDEQEHAQAVIDDRAVSSSNSSTNTQGLQAGPVAAPRSVDGSDNHSREVQQPVQQLQHFHQQHQRQQEQHQRPQAQPQQAQQDYQPLQQAATLSKPSLRSLSSSGRDRVRSPSHAYGHGHGHAQTAPAVPRLVSQTPEQGAVVETQELPELGNMSPIRM